MEKQNNSLMNTYARSTCLVVCLLMGISIAYSQKNLGKLNADGYQHTISYLDEQYQDATIPSNVSHDYLFLRAYGADGGYKRARSKPGGSKNTDGGRGALVEGYFKVGSGENEIPPGSTVRFIVGQKGTNLSNAKDGGAGGGGGTAIAFKAPGKERWHLLIVAGGGGGGRSSCCSLGAKGRPGRAYDGFPGKGYSEDCGEDNHYGGSARKSKNSSCQGGQGWSGDFPSGAPVGGKSYRRKSWPVGGWGFGAGGSGSHWQKVSGGGGGYTGGYGGKISLDGLHSRAEGGTSYTDYGMVGAIGSTSIFSTERGTTDSPSDGRIIYRFSDSPFKTIRPVSQKGKCLAVKTGQRNQHPD